MSGMDRPNRVLCDAEGWTLKGTKKIKSAEM